MHIEQKDLRGPVLPYLLLFSLSLQLDPNIHLFVILCVFFGKPVLIPKAMPLPFHSLIPISATAADTSAAQSLLPSVAGDSEHSCSRA